MIGPRPAILAWKISRLHNKPAQACGARLPAAANLAINPLTGTLTPLWQIRDFAALWPDHILSVVQHRHIIGLPADPDRAAID